jgi:hypothetical protein
MLSQTSEEGVGTVSTPNHASFANAGEVHAIVAAASEDASLNWSGGEVRLGTSSSAPPDRSTACFGATLPRATTSTHVTRAQRRSCRCELRVLILRDAVQTKPRGAASWEAPTGTLIVVPGVMVKTAREFSRKRKSSFFGRGLNTSLRLERRCSRRVSVGARFPQRFPSLHEVCCPRAARVSDRCSPGSRSPPAGARFR